MYASREGIADSASSTPLVGDIFNHMRSAWKDMFIAPDGSVRGKLMDVLCNTSMVLMDSIHVKAYQLTHQDMVSYIFHGSCCNGNFREYEL